MKEVKIKDEFIKLGQAMKLDGDIVSFDGEMIKIVG